MLIKTISFDVQNVNWQSNRDYNRMFLRTEENYLNSIIAHRGYLYLNQICETLGDGWNPDDYNLCIRNDDADRLKFIEFELIDKPNNSFEVNIYQCE